MSWRGDKRTSAQRGYGARWQRRRAHYLQHNPLCVMCKAEGRITVATVVDHKIPHRGDEALMWDESNWQALCATHHSSDKQALEKSGKVKQRIGDDGFPIEGDPRGGQTGSGPVIS